MNGETPANPILQCLGTKAIAGSGIERIRLLLSDGVHSFGSELLQCFDLILKQTICS